MWINQVLFYVYLRALLSVCCSFMYSVDACFFFPLYDPPVTHYSYSAEHNIISSSSSPREQNVALGIKLFNYSVSSRLANLKLSHPPPWTHMWYVRVRVWLLVLVLGCTTLLNVPTTMSTHNHMVFMHALICRRESHHLLLQTGM